MKKFMKMVGSGVVLAGFLCLLPWVTVQAATVTVTCPASIQAAVDVALPGDVIKVTGNCTENVLIRNEKLRLTLDGQNSTILQAATSGSPVLNVRGKGILVQNFEITGGSSGINVNRGSSANIFHNNIHNSGSGIIVNQFSFSIIRSNNIHDNLNDGILIAETSDARIGFDTNNDPSPSPNTIQYNGGRGITVTMTSNAHIAGNTISYNEGDGIGVFRLSQTNIADNTIDGNGGNGVNVGQNAGVNLGEDNPSTFLSQANATTVLNPNTLYGVNCSMGGYVRVHWGNWSPPNGFVNGLSGKYNMANNCPFTEFTP